MEDMVNEAVNTNTPPNTFGGRLMPIGTVEELLGVCDLLREGEATIRTNDLVDAINFVYNITIETRNHLEAAYYVNRYWHDRLNEAAFGPEEESEESNEEIEETIHHEIPENSQTLTVDETTSRFSDAIWYSAIQKKTIILAGIGGIGRFGNLVNFFHNCPSR